MGWNGSGVWSAPSLPGSFNPAITGQQATAADWNTFLAALAGTDGLSKAICRDGQTTITANLPMSGFRHTGVGDASALTHYGVVGQIINNDYIYGADIGVADAYEVTLPVSIVTYVVGQEFRTIIAHTNLTTTPTFKITGLNPGTIVNPNGTALVAGQLPAGGSAVVQVSGVTGGTPTFQLLSSPAWAAAQFTTGDVKITLKTTADTGWVLFNDGTIGSASSGGTTRANADCQPLYTLVWNNISDIYAPVSGGRGANAAADFAANKPMKLLTVLGRYLGVAGAGAGLTSRALGQNLGAETVTVSATDVGITAGNTTPSTGGGNVQGVNFGAASAKNIMNPGVYFNIMAKL